MIMLLAEREIESRLARLPQWTRAGDAITRLVPVEYHAGAALIVRVTDASQFTSRHADINLSADGVRFTITTHVAGGDRLTIADFDLAEHIDAITADVSG